MPNRPARGADHGCVLFIASLKLGGSFPTSSLDPFLNLYIGDERFRVHAPPVILPHPLKVFTIYP